MTIPATFTESIVEAALDWLADLGYTIANGQDIAPGEPRAERQTFGEVVLVARPNPSAPIEYLPNISCILAYYPCFLMNA